MGTMNKNIQITSIVTSAEERVIQKFTIKLAGANTGIKKPAKPQDEPAIKFRSAEEPEAEVITSEHVDSESLKINGRHGG